MGWGRLGSRGQIENPLGKIDKTYKLRPGRRDTGGEFGGASRSKSYFRGPAAWFGGARYRLARWPLQFVAEYSSDDYAREVGFGTIATPSPWNFALEWRPQSILLSPPVLHSSSLGLRFNSALDTKATPKRKRVRYSIALLSRGRFPGRRKFRPRSLV